MPYIKKIIIVICHPCDKRSSFLYINSDWRFHVLIVLISITIQYYNFKTWFLDHLLHKVALKIQKWLTCTISLKEFYIFHANEEKLYSVLLECDNIYCKITFDTKLGYN